MKFAPIFAALQRNGYDATVAVEPFDYVPDGPGAAAFAAGYLRGVREVARLTPTQHSGTLSWRHDDSDSSCTASPAGWG